jgi:hypothetical protein
MKELNRLTTIAKRPPAASSLPWIILVISVLLSLTGAVWRSILLKRIPVYKPKRKWRGNLASSGSRPIQWA